MSTSSGSSKSSSREDQPQMQGVQSPHRISQSQPVTDGSSRYSSTPAIQTSLDNPPQSEKEQDNDGSSATTSNFPAESGSRSAYMQHMQQKINEAELNWRRAEATYSELRAVHSQLDDQVNLNLQLYNSLQSQLNELDGKGEGGDMRSNNSRTLAADGNRSSTSGNKE